MKRGPYKYKEGKMGKLTNCKVCGQRCEDKQGGMFGIFCLLFGFPFSLGSFCCDACKRQWAGGGRIWFGKKWRQQFITLLIVLAIVLVVYMIFR